MSASRPKSASQPSASDEDAFIWDNRRYEAVVEQHQGVNASLLDHGICIGLTLFGLISLASSVMMAVSQLLPH